MLHSLAYPADELGRALQWWSSPSDDDDDEKRRELGMIEFAIGSAQSRFRFPSSPQKLHEAMRQLKDNTFELHVGGFYADPETRVPVGHPLVLDFDSTSFACPAAGGATNHCCPICTGMAVRAAFTAGAAVRDRVFEGDDARTYVFASGGKGAHAYIVAPGSAAMTQFERRALVRELVQGELGLPADFGASTELKHLVKAPYSPHPKTRRLAVCLRTPPPAAFDVEVELPRVYDLGGGVVELLQRFPIEPIE